MLRDFLPERLLNNNRVELIKEIGGQKTLDNSKSAGDVYILLKKEKIKHNYKHTNNKKLIPYIADYPVAGLNYDFYVDMLKLAKKDYLISKYNIDVRIYSSELLKKLSDFALQSGPIVNDFEYLVGINYLYGYNYKPNTDDVPDLLKDWVQNDFTPNYRGSVTEFQNRFRKAVKSILTKRREEKPNISIKMSPKEFVQNIPFVGTKGSAYEPGSDKLDIDVDGIKAKALNNKYSKSMALPTDVKLKMIMTKMKLKAKCSIKVELYPKVRLIVGADYKSFLKQRYVETFLNDLFDGCDLSTLWQTTEQKRKMWIDFSIYKKNNKDWNVPIDQTEFDHKVTLVMNRIMLEEIQAILPENSDNYVSMKEVIETLIWGLENTTVHWKDQKAKEGTEELILKYKSGVLSGWQLTAFLDTLANIAESMVALELCEELEVPIKFLRFNAQGDDQFTKFKYLHEGLCYWAAMSSFGFSIHITKNFFSTLHNEYLRKFSTDEQVNGYPCRMINGIMWQYPGDQFEKNGLARLNGLKDKWLKFAQRLKINFKKIKNLFIKDAVKMRIKREVVIKFLMVSKLRGGAGIDGSLTNMEPFAFYDDDPKQNIVVKDGLGGEVLGDGGNVTIHGAGYNEFKQLFGEYQQRSLTSGVLM